MKLFGGKGGQYTSDSGDAGTYSKANGRKKGMSEFGDVEFGDIDLTEMDNKSPKREPTRSPGERAGTGRANQPGAERVRRMPAGEIDDICSTISAAIESEEDELTASTAYAASSKKQNGSSGMESSRPRKKRGIFKRILLTLLAIILVMAAGVAVAYVIYVKPPQTSVSQPNTTGGGTTNDPAEDGGEIPAVSSSKRKDGVYTFLIVGKDQISSSTDTIIVGTFDTVNHTLDLVSVPRDTLVNVSWSVKKINSIYANKGGIEGLVAGLESILGYKIDSYACVDLNAFVELIDAIGGVYYDVPRDMYYEDDGQNLLIDLKAGYQWLSGEQAVGVVRYRAGYTNGDIGRIGTQQDFLLSVAKQILTVGNIPNLASVASIYEEYVDTNLKTGNIIWYAKEFLKLSSEDMNFYTVPGNYGDSVKGGSYVTIYVDEWLGMINEHLNPYKEDILSKNLNIFTRDAKGNLYATDGKVENYNFYQYK